MAKGEDSPSEMARARQSDGISVVFDQNSLDSTRSHSHSRSRGSSGSSRSSGSGHYRGRGSHRGRCRSSSSSSSSSRSSSRSKSRSHPRCHRVSSRCHCNSHRRYGRDHHRRSPPRHYRAHSRSYSRSHSPDRYSYRRRYRSRSRSHSRSSSYWRRAVSHFRCKFSQSPAKTNRSRSRSRSSGNTVSLSLDDKRELLQAAKANAMRILGVEKLELPESVKSVLSEQPESKRVSPEPKRWVRQAPKVTPSQSGNAESVSSPKMSPKRKISFSFNNSVAKPTVAASSCAKITPRVDSYESRKPYGHWIPVKSIARKRTAATSH